MNVSTAKRAELEKRLDELAKKATSEKPASDGSGERAAKRSRGSDVEGKVDADRSSQQGETSTALVRFLDYQLSVVINLILFSMRITVADTGILSGG